MFTRETHSTTKSASGSWTTWQPTASRSISTTWVLPQPPTTATNSVQNSPTGTTMDPVVVPLRPTANSCWVLHPVTSAAQPVPVQWPVPLLVGTRAHQLAGSHGRGYTRDHGEYDGWCTLPHKQPYCQQQTFTIMTGAAFICTQVQRQSCPDLLGHGHMEQPSGPERWHQHFLLPGGHIQWPHRMWPGHLPTRVEQSWRRGKLAEFE